MLVVHGFVLQGPGQGDSARCGCLEGKQSCMHPVRYPSADDTIAFYTIRTHLLTLGWCIAFLLAILLVADG